MYNPLVSIVIPVYNGSNFLKESIDSALNQTYKNCEVIVINDGSEDNGATQEIALSYGSMIRYFEKKNGGVSSALNMGIENMKGEWFSWLSHDDLYEKNKIEKQIELAAKILESRRKETIIMCSSILINETGGKIFHPSKKLNGEFSGKEIFTKCFNSSGINGCSLLIHKDALDRFGKFDTEYKYLQDAKYWFNLMVNNYTFICHKDEHVMNRVHSGQITSKYPELYQIENQNLTKHIIKQLSNMQRENELLLKSYLYSSCRDNNKVTYESIIILLKEKHKFRVEEKVRVWGCISYGKIYIFLKKTYKSIFIKSKRKK